MLNKAKERAKNSFEYLYASRSLGVAQASFGLLKESNNSFADALKSFTLYKDSNPPKFQMDYENAQTYLAMTYWSAQSNCDESMKYQGELDKLTSILPQFVRVPLLDRIRRNKDLVLSQTKGACKL